MSNSAPRIVAIVCGGLTLVVAAMFALRLGTNQANSPELRSSQNEPPVSAASGTLAHDANTDAARANDESRARPELATTETRRATLVVDVRNARTRVPLADVDVVAFRFDRRFPTSSGRTGERRAMLDQTATSTADGRVELDVEANVDLVLHVRHADTPRILRDIAPLAPNEIRETTVLLDMPKRSRFFGRIVDGATGDVPDGASVTIEEFDVDARHFASTLVPHSIDSDSEAPKMRRSECAPNSRFVVSSCSTGRSHRARASKCLRRPAKSKCAGPEQVWNAASGFNSPKMRSRHWNGVLSAERRAKPNRSHRVARRLGR